MADLSSFMPTQDAQVQALSNQFDQLWVANGHKMPQTTQDMIPYSQAKQQFIKQGLVQQTNNASNMLSNAVSPALIPPEAVGNVVDKLGSFFKNLGSNIPNVLTQPIASTGQGMPGLFQSSPYTAPATPATPAVPAKPAGSDMSAILAALQNKQQTPSAPSFTAPQMSGSNIAPPDVQGNTNDVLALLSQNINSATDAAKQGLAGINQANTAFDQSTANRPNLLQFMQQARQNAGPAPSRDQTQLTDSDKYNLLMRLGTGMLAHNKEGFGQALGESGGAALNYADQVKNQRYADAMDAYKQKLQDAATDTTLTATDYKNTVDAAQRSYEHAIGATGAQEKVTTAGIPSVTEMAKAVGDSEKTISENYRTQVLAAMETQKTNVMAQVEMQKARMMLETAMGKAKTGMTPSEYLKSADDLDKAADNLAMSKDTTAQAQAAQYKKFSNAFRQAAIRGAM